MKCLESENDVMKLVRALIYSSKNFPIRPAVLPPLYTLLHDDVFSIEENQNETVFIQAKQKLRHSCESAKVNTEKAIFIMVDASAIGVGTKVVQSDDTGQMQVISHNSLSFTKSEQKTP